MKVKLEQTVQTVVKDVFGEKVSIELTRPEPEHGDYATNIALQLAGKLGKKPRDIAEMLQPALVKQLGKQIASIDIAGPGFLNIRLSDEALWDYVNAAPAQTLKGKTVVAEYSDPNPFKVLHVGHLYTSFVGDAVANLLQAAGARVHRVNFGGDIGMHVAKTMWAIIEEFGGENPDKLKDIKPNTRAEWLAAAYMRGTGAYEDDVKAKEAIIGLNKRLYALHTDKDKKSPLAQLYWTTRTWSYDYFDEFYERIGTHFERYYPESETADAGLKTVRDQIGPVFEESDGAVVFRGDKHDLHTRVFINSEGLPTYEAKDVGLIMKKWQDYHFDLSVIITGNEQAQYMQVVLKAIEQFAPELAQATTHLTHGIVKMTGGEKMSSRKGNILRAVDVLDTVEAATKKQHPNEAWNTALGAIKYAFIKQRIGGDIAFDVQESVALEGRSGPYLQYAHARACSILAKADTKPNTDTKLEVDERALLRKIGEFTEVVDKAIVELMPHHIATYLYELAQGFNRFYEHNRVIGDKRQAVRLALVKEYAHVLKQGLTLLGIPAPEHL